jgi:hypothetical protein
MAALKEKEPGVVQMLEAQVETKRQKVSCYQELTGSGHAVP